MDRDRALQLMESHVKNKNLRKHMLAAEAVMRSLAVHFSEDPDKWGITGLLHDIDYDETKDDPAKHGLRSSEILRSAHFDEDLIHAVLAHCDKVIPQSNLDWSLYCTDPVTGLVIACALIHPEKKLSVIDTDFVLNRFKEKRFAAGADRDTIMKCENIGLSLDQFAGIALKSLQGISEPLGL